MTPEQPRAAEIRTPDQRLRVFVSSTLGELADERAAVSRAVTSLRLAPILFELGARPHPPQELYRAYLAQSDIFVGIYWQRYGWVGPGMDISGLEDEFLLSEGMPRLLYIKTPAPDREAGLSAMIGKLQTEGTTAYKSFRSLRELARLVRDDLAVLLSERFTNGGTAPSTTPATAATAPVSRTLPSVSTALFGREQDIEAVAALLEDPDVRLVTLTGPGGIGKTRLAIAVGERMEHRLSTAPVFVPLASIGRPELVLPRIAAAVGATIEGARPILDVLIEHLADRPTLLVLDNLEQVTAVAPELDALLTRCPGLKILATSRTVLRLRAENAYAVEPLAIPSLGTNPTVEQAAALPPVQLFVERARAVRRDFALTASNAPAVAEICARLDGLPLAIELAAARIRLLDPAALRSRLGTRLDALGAGPVDLAEHQRTLRATIEWSVDLLDEPERDLLAALSVFVDGWTLEAAVAVAGVDENRTLDLLDSLSGHSLVSIALTDSGPRFRMLETVKEFSTELASETPRLADIGARHATYFLEFVETTKWPLPDEKAWAERLETEEGNIREAIGWLFVHDIAPLPRTLRYLWRFWQLRDRMSEGRVWVADLMPRVATLDNHAQAELWLTAAMTALEVGDDDGALKTAEALERLTGNLDDPYVESATQLAMSWALPLRGDLDGALAAAAASLQGFRQQDEPFMAANAAYTLGMLELARSHYELARQHLSEVRSLGQRLGSNWLTAVSGIELSTIGVEAGEVEAGRLDDAQALLVESLAGASAERSTLTATFCLVAFARLALARNDGRSAAVALGAVAGLRERAGLLAWPMVRSSEADLRARVEASLDQADFKAAFGEGSGLNLRDAVSMIRGEDATEPAAE